MKINLIFILNIIILLSNVISKSKSEWISRSIYQILTDRFARTSDTGNCDYKKYCGGNYKGIIQHLDYIKGMGFDAIWISPIVENTPNSYHGYHMSNIYKLNEHFGNEDDFKKLISECHKRDIWVMIDVVANHVGPIGTNYSKIIPFNKFEHYHEKCDIKDWNNQWQIENCRLSDLPDLKQENEWVSQILLNWIHDVVKKYNIDGLRIDTVMEVPKWFWNKFAKSAGVFQIGEVFNGNINYVAEYQKYLDSVFNYPLYYTIENSFCGSFRNLESYWFNDRKVYPNPEYIATFIENHDNPRFLYRCRDKDKFTNAVVFSLLWEGIPVFYYGGEQYFSGGADPYNREPLWNNYNSNSNLYKILSKIHSLRKKEKIWNKPIVQRYADDNFYAFTRGNILACFTNSNRQKRTITYHNFKERDKLCNILVSDDCIFVKNNKINIIMGKYPRIYVLVQNNDDLEYL